MPAFTIALCWTRGKAAHCEKPYTTKGTDTVLGTSKAERGKDT